jgi:hypothetical protein
MKVFVIKDEMGKLRPQASIWVIDDASWREATLKEWETRLSKKREFDGCSMVEAELREI